ncbi:MAG TPA: hypoxanthine phosphoribosyltransferase [Candidatus Ozemobacteraceae bacterium]|nr:hypoxanthine phosphoribosyltransferase [Candidatus Ozemobacteraceae bacterium]
MTSTSPHPDIERVLIGTGEIQARIAELGRRITADYAGETIVLVCILKGAFLFMADLCRHIELPVNTEFMAISSYGHATKSSGVVRILKDLNESIEGRNVLIVEDIVDTGLTLSYLIDLLSARHPKSLKVCSLCSKPQCHQRPVRVDYCGFELPSEFAVGYGLDYKDYYRNVPFIGVLKPDIYERER